MYSPAVLFLLCFGVVIGGELLTSVQDDSLEDGVTEKEVPVADDLFEPAEEKAPKYPCACNENKCSCCTGNLLENFNISMRQRLCSHLSFDPEDTLLGIRIAWNERVLYKTTVSGKNPPPICLPIPRLQALRVCVRLNNLYFIGRNVHTCVVLETQWQRETAFAFNFDCIRLGANGVALVKPEDGGGIPNVIEPAVTTPDGIEDYDENVRNSQ